MVGSMKAVVLDAFHQDFTIREMPIPEIGSDEVLIKVMASGICGTDIHIQGGKIESVKPPYTPGHETAGILVEKGSDVSGFEIGDHVIVAIDIVCHRCRFCLEKRENLCQDLVRIGFERNGGHAQYLACPAENLVKISKKIAFEKAAIIADAVACMYHAIKNQGAVKQGSRVCILGIGGLGMQGVQITKELGGTVYCTSRQDKKLEIAKTLGADALINTACTDLQSHIVELTDGEMCDVVFDNIGIESSIMQSLSILKPGGKVIIVGYLDESFKAPYMDMMMHEKEIIGIRGSRRADLVEAVRLIEDGKIDPHVYKTYPLGKFNEAICDLREGRSLGRTVIFPQEV